MVVALLRMALAVVVHPGNETSGTYSELMLASFLRSIPPAMRPFPDAEPPLMGDQFTLAPAFPNTG